MSKLSYYLEEALSLTVKVASIVIVTGVTGLFIGLLVMIAKGEL